MKLAPRASSLLVVLAAIASTGPWAGCGGDVALGTKNEGGSPAGTGGVLGNGGVGAGGGLGSGGAAATSGSGGSLGGGGNAIGTGGGAGGATGGVGGTSGAGGLRDGGAFDGPIQCEYDGKLYNQGETRSLLDCNYCVCGLYTAGAWACTGRICDTGGASGTGGSTGAGGNTGTGGRTGTGGVPGSGGRTGAGGATGTAGITGTVCTDGAGGVGGGIGATCPAGQFCDLPSQCGRIADTTGVCRPTGPAVGCIAAEIPVCGCDGKTYSNDCERMRVGVLKASDGPCAVDGGVDGGTTNSACPYQCRTDSSGVTGWYSGNTLVCAANCTACVASCSAVGTRSEGCYASCPPGSTAAAGCNSSSSGLIAYEFCGGSYPTAWLAWELPGGAAGTGPAVVVSASTGWAGTWDNVAGFLGSSSSPRPTTGANQNYSLSRAQTDDLFSRLASVNFSVLPHPGSVSCIEAYPALYFRLCQDCAATTFKYNSASQLSPEMDQVWAWFDGVLGATANTNPHNWCD